MSIQNNYWRRKPPNEIPGAFYTATAFIQQFPLNLSLLQGATTLNPLLCATFSLL